MQPYKQLIIWLLLTLFSTITSANQIVFVNESSPNAVNTPKCWTGGNNTPCVSFDLGIEGLHHLSKAKHVELRIAEREYNFTNNETGHFNNYTNGISIIGKADNMNGNTKPVTIICSDGIGFSFINSSNIIINGIIFKGCSQLQNSTSFDAQNNTVQNSSGPTFLQTYVSLYFLFCKDVNLVNVNVESTYGTGIVLYNIGGSNKIEHCDFLENKFKDHNEISGGGGMYIEYSYCVPTASGINCLNTGESNVNNISSYNSDASVHVINSHFIMNKANVSSSSFNQGTFILPQKQNHTAFGRGGGLSVFFKGSANHINITIEQCLFQNNSALWGGGIFAEFQDHAFNNTLQVNSCNIWNNKVYFIDTWNEGTGGGGSRVGFIFYNDTAAYSNSIVFDHCWFINNSAYFGGGVSFYTARQHKYRPNKLKLHNCLFEHNQARLGAAIDLSAWHSSIVGTIPTPLVDNCAFRFNSPRQGGLIGIGAMYIDAVHVQFQNNVEFESNQGSALAITGSHIEVLKNCTMTFQNNSGRNGGAIALLGNAFIVTNDNSQLIFNNNRAYYSGGAIYYFSSGERDLISSRNCFIRFHDITLPPDYWTSTFEFRNNTASEHPNSIYASTILPCVWGGAYGATKNNKDVNMRVFCWNDYRRNWRYFLHDGSEYPCCNTSHETNCESSPQVSTAASMFFPDSNLNSSYNVIPGNITTLNLPVKNDMDREVTDNTIFIARITHTKLDADEDGKASFKAGHDYQYNYISHQQLFLLGDENATVTLEIETVDPIVIQKQITVHFNKCPPGYKIKSSKCVCAGNYNSFVVCDETNYAANIIRGVWIGQYPHYNDSLLVGLSPYVQDVSVSETIQLPNDASELSDYLCGHRKGVLCGECKKGYGVAMNTEDFNCIPCSEEDAHRNWFYYMLTEFLPVTIFFAAVFLFSMTVTFGPLNSYIFFAQVVTTVVKFGADGMIPLENTIKHYKDIESIYVIPYDFWNLNFFRTLMPKYCLSRNITTLDVLSLGYVTALYPLLLLIVFITLMSLYNRGVRIFVCIFRPLHRCLARFRQWTNLQQSITGGIAVFIVISYTKLTLVSLQLLHFVPLYNAVDEKPVYHVFYFDGSIKFGNEGWKYIMIASIVISTFVIIPPLLLAYPSALRFLEWISCGRLRLGKLYPTPKLQAFLDEFHGCYKDGSDGGLDCRWFASLYFCLRIALFVVYSVIPSWHEQYIAQILIFLCTVLMIAVIRPYREEWINNIDVTMFLTLASITALSQYNLQLTRTGQDVNTLAFAIQYILIVMPLLYCIGYYCTLMWSRTKSRCIDFAKRNLVNDNAALLDDGSEGSRDNLVDSTHVSNFLDYMENTGRMSGRVRLSNSHRWNTNRGNVNHPQPGIINSNQLASESTPLLTPSSSNTGSSSSQTSHERRGRGQRQTEEGKKDESQNEPTAIDVQSHSEGYQTTPTRDCGSVGQTSLLTSSKF